MQMILMHYRYNWFPKTKMHSLEIDTKISRGFKSFLPLTENLEKKCQVFVKLGIGKLSKAHFDLITHTNFFFWSYLWRVLEVSSRPLHYWRLHLRLMLKSCGPPKSLRKTRAICKCSDTRNTAVKIKVAWFQEFRFRLTRPILFEACPVKSWPS